MELIKKLAIIQKELNAPKSQRNNFGNYNYRSCEDILEAVKPLLGECALTVSDEVVMLGDRFYIKAIAGITDGENHVTAFGWAREALSRKGMDDSQLTGSTSSYARKYALNGLFCIDDNKDADTNESKKQSDNSPENINWYNDFDSQKKAMMSKIKSGEQTSHGIIDSLEKAGFVVSRKAQDQIKGLG